MTGVTEKLVKFAVTTGYDQLPDDIIHEAKRCLLDCIGCALAGTTTDKGKYAIQLARRLGGPPESTIIGTGDKLSVCNTAFANGEITNAMDFDVGSDPHHSPPCLMSASLSTAECSNASGKDLILAFIIGAEVSARIASGLPQMLRLSETGIWELAPGHGFGSCSIGAAASAGKILKLDHLKMSHALGISAFATPVPTYARWCQSPPTPMTKYAFIGWISMAGVTSALLAEMGYTGDTTVLDGEYGFWRFHSNEKSCWDSQKVAERLGEDWYWLVTRKMYKPFPSCGIFMTTLKGFIKLIDENNLKADDIDEVSIRIAIPLLRDANSVFYNREIKTGIDAQFSAPFLFAAAACGIRESYKWQDSASISDPRILKFMDKVSVGEWNEYPKIGGTVPNIIPYSIEIRAKGKRFGDQKTISNKQGNMQENTWMTDKELLEKFRINASRILPSSKIDRAASLILGIGKG